MEVLRLSRGDCADAEVHDVQSRCRNAEMQKCRGAEVQWQRCKSRGADTEENVQTRRCRGAGVDEVRCRCNGAARCR